MASYFRLVANFHFFPDISVVILAPDFHLPPFTARNKAVSAVEAVMFFVAVVFVVAMVFVVAATGLGCRDGGC